MVSSEVLLAAEADYEDDVTGTGTIPELFEASAERQLELPAQQYKGGIYGRA